MVPLREQAQTRDRWLQERLHALLPELMQEAGIDVWIVTAREYNEDPVIMSLLPSRMLSARRRTTLVFHAPKGAPFTAMAIAHAGVGVDSHYKTVWEKSMTAEASESEEGCLRRVVASLSPERIGVNVSASSAFADGLSFSEHAWLMKALGEELAALTVSAEKIAIGWLEWRLEEEIEAAVIANEIAHAVIAEAFSSSVVKPGVTTAEDVAWWLRQTAQELGLPCWFHPTVSIQRQGVELGDIGSSPDVPILRGDLLHCDFGFRYMGLATDTQQNAYVLKEGERAAPDGLVSALRVANEQQDILAREMRAGRSGNEILLATLNGMSEAGIEGRIYTHSLGVHGHGAGVMIGRYDLQEEIPGVGDLLVRDSTMFAFEMFAIVEVPEWQGQRVKLATEQVTSFMNGRATYLGGRQTELHLIG